jgi:1-acyl-sn-glycerol-3-phosphate acyltransferase
MNTIWFFKRGGRAGNLETFFTWIDEMFGNPINIRPNLLVYPEGHRHHRVAPMPLKAGMIKYAFSRKLKVQVFIAKNWEKTFREKRLWVDLKGTTVYYKMTAPIDPTDFADEDVWFEHIHKTFNDLFAEMYEGEEPVDED